MRTTLLKTLVIIGFTVVANTALILAEDEIEVMSRTNTTLLLADGEWIPMTEDLVMPYDITVFTNGTFQIKDGKIRTLKEGEILRADGNLLDPDGSIMPAYDHIAMKGGVTVYRDGEGARITENLTLPDGTTIEPDGAYTRPSGRRSRLVDGQLLTLDGVSIDGLDTVSFKNGKVTVFKGGAFITLVVAPNIVTGMYDGTRFGGDGVVMGLDGSTRQMTEGEVIVLPGVRADW